MRSDVSGSRLLAARDLRQRRMEEVLAAGPRLLVSLALNIPGREKMPGGAQELFEEGRQALAPPSMDLAEAGVWTDPLGPFALFVSERDPAEIKRECVAIEEETAVARLLDLDVYDGGGRPVDRRRLGLPQRACLLCPRPARECIRAGRHDLAALERRVNELLAPFRP